jgi:hypothetical protein
MCDRVGAGPGPGRFFKVVVLACMVACILRKDENGRKRSENSSTISTFIFEYENESENDKAGHENERELTEYLEF